METLADTVVKHQGRQRLKLGAATLLALALTALATSPAAAHTGTGVVGGFSAGFTHPIFGYDHLLAMLAVGLWGAQIGGRALWELPVTFPLVMAIGGALGIAGVPLPQVEVLIALSVLFLGLAIAAAFKPASWIAMIAIGLFAIFHGHAHEAELPNAADPLAYAVGFVVATGLIHLVGIGIGLVVGQRLDGWVTRAIGGAIAASGVYFLAA